MERKGINCLVRLSFSGDERVDSEEIDSDRFKGCAKGDFLSLLNLRYLTPVFRSNSDKVAPIPEQ